MAVLRNKSGGYSDSWNKICHFGIVIFGTCDFRCYSVLKKMLGRSTYNCAQLAIRWNLLNWHVSNWYVKYHHPFVFKILFSDYSLKESSIIAEKAEYFDRTEMATR